MKEISLGKEMLSEFMGTMVLIIFGAGNVAMTVLFGKTLNITWDNITFGWGLAVLLGIMAGLPSGAHINPAVWPSRRRAVSRGARCCPIRWRRSQAASPVRPSSFSTSRPNGLVLTRSLPAPLASSAPSLP